MGSLLALALVLTPAPQTQAADHADSPNVANDRAADLADTYIFIDPADSTKVVIMMTAQGFIVPGEAVNLVGFDPKIRYRFELETSGDARPDKFIDIRFSARTAANAPQTATITLPNNRTFTAPTTVPTLAGTPPPFVITSDATSMVDFFAGEVDDPFFFDIPGFARFRASVLAGTPDATQLQRGRDTFAGYNTMAIAMRMPISLIGPSGNIIGINSVAQRQATQKLLKSGEVVGKGNKFINADRAGVPAVNALLIPFARKNEFNTITTQDDADGRFAGPGVLRHRFRDDRHRLRALAVLGLGKEPSLDQLHAQHLEVRRIDRIMRGHVITRHRARRGRFARHGDEKGHARSHRQVLDHGCRLDLP